MVVTIIQDNFPTKVPLDDIINVVIGRNMFHDGVQVHFVDGKNRHAVFEELWKDAAPLLNCTKANFEVCVKMQGTGTAPSYV